ncbi:MAG: RDD family protein [Methanobacteriaceae archaeon]|nr:RDD family protein [Methanobacteriaceae archaeon]MDZ4171528.1 RDD family protein [Methanobacteriaceae archaeon]
MEELTKKRFWAFIIDFIFITALMWILSIVIYPLLIVTGFFSVFNYWLLLLAVLIIGYFTYLEGSYSKTVGKSLMGIGLKALDENLTYKKTFVRNLSKILWFPLIIDLLAAYFTKNSSLRILDKYAGTVVVIDE